MKRTILLSFFLVCACESASTYAQTWREASVRVSNYRGKVIQTGSGTIIGANGESGLVLTAKHLFEDGVGQLVVRRRDGHGYRARLLTVAKDCDLAALTIKDTHDLPTVKLAPAQPREATLVGYGADGIMRGQFGVYASTVDDGDVFYSFIPREGDSGGGVFDRKGQLCGVAWGVDADAGITRAALEIDQDRHTRISIGRRWPPPATYAAINGANGIAVPAYKVKRFLGLPICGKYCARPGRVLVEPGVPMLALADRPATVQLAPSAVPGPPEPGLYNAAIEEPPLPQLPNPPLPSKGGPPLIDQAPIPLPSPQFPNADLPPIGRKVMPPIAEPAPPDVMPVPVPVPGPQGPMGPQGPEGARGPQGVPGAMGSIPNVADLYARIAALEAADKKPFKLAIRYPDGREITHLYFPTPTARAQVGLSYGMGLYEPGTINGNSNGVAIPTP